MAPKTTSGSGFHFIFVIYVVDLVDNATNLETTSWHFFEKFDLKVEKFKKYLNELREFPTVKFLKMSHERPTFGAPVTPTLGEGDKLFIALASTTDWLTNLKESPF